MKKIKKITVTALILALALNLSIPAFAEIPAEGNGSTVTDAADQGTADEGKDKNVIGSGDETGSPDDAEKKDPEDADDTEDNVDAENADDDEEVNEETDTDEAQDDTTKEDKDADNLSKRSLSKATGALSLPVGEIIPEVAPTAAENDDISVSSISTEWIEDGEKIKVSASILGISDTSDLKAGVYLQGKEQKADLNENTASATVKITSNDKDYEIYIKFTSGSGEVLGESEHITVKRISRNLRKTEFRVTDSLDDEETGVIKYEGKEDYPYLEYYLQGSSNTYAVNAGVITGLGRGTYIIVAPGYSDGYLYYRRTSAELYVKSGNNATVQYAVRTSGDENVRFDKKVQTVNKGNPVSIKITPADPSTHYIVSDSIRVEPADNISGYTYGSTGELYIENITGDITVYASAAEKAVVSSLNVKSVSFNDNPTYSEGNAGIKTTIQVEAKDQNGNPVPGVKIYYKQNTSDTSSDQNRSTGENGIAEFTSSYSVQNGQKKADYKSVFGIESSFEGITVTTDIHLILQLKSDLVLYTDQIIGTKPDQNDGKIINVPEGYEIWTGDVHDGYLVVGSGEWEKIVNGEYSGLSSGLHALRAGAKTDGNTYYFASDCDFFEVPRGTWDITIDKAGSENVIFTGNDVLTAKPGGTVYVYLKPAEGYSIDSFSVNRPDYVSGRIYYSKDSGYIVIEKVTGSIVLTVKAVKAAVNTPGTTDKTDITEDNKTDVTEPDQIIQTDNDSNNGYDYEAISQIAAVNPVQIPFVLLNANAPVPGGTVLSARVPLRTAASSIQKKAFHEIADEIESEKSVSPEPAKTKEPVKKEIEKPAETKTIENQAVALSGSIDVNNDTKEAGNLWIILFIIAGAIVVVTIIVIQKQRSGQNSAGR
ncbi:MAG: hypothetical protein K5870_00755 [Lachnospiraceae bacterium]|nr:hypothetical protein [Lachnospiraceae bacterium]